MLICIDSNQFIFGVTGADIDAAALMDILPELDVAIPRLIVNEVVRNLVQVGMDKQFFTTVHQSERFAVVDEPVPIELVEKYANLGLPTKADALIGAFVEWVGAEYLISDNRHFLQEFFTDVYEVLSPAEFLQRFKAGAL